MKNVNRISGYFAFVFLWTFVLSTFVNSQRLQQRQDVSPAVHITLLAHHHFSHTMGCPSPVQQSFEKYISESETNEENEDGDHFGLYSFAGKEQTYLCNSHTPSYHLFKKHPPQQKKYLLFHCIKVDC